MTKKNDSLDKIDEQIRKLEGKEEVVTKEEAKKTLDDTDTKIFDSEEASKVNESVAVNDKEDTKVELSIKDEEIKKEEVEETVEEAKEEKIETTNTKKNMSKVVIIILIVLILAICSIGGFFLFKHLTKDDDKPVEDDTEVVELTDKDREEILKNYGEAVEGIIGVYFSQQGVLLAYEDAIKLVEFEETVKCSEYEVYKDGKLYLNDCSVNGIKTKATYGVKQEVIETGEGILNVYVNKRTNEATLTTPKNASDYDTYAVHCGNSYSEPVLLSNYGDYVFYFDEESYLQMKNYKTDEKALSYLSYSQILPIEITEGVYDSTYVAVNVNDFWGIYNVVNGQQIISPMYNWFSSAVNYGVGLYNSIRAVGNNLIIANDGKNYGVINYVTNKSVIPFDYNQLYASGNYIWASDSESNGYIYDTTGNKYLDEDYDKIYGIVNGIYILVRDKEDIKLVQIDGKVLYNYGKIENMGDVNFSLIYNNGPLFQAHDTSQEGLCIEILYDPNTKEGTTKSTMCGGIAKPVLYLYPKKTTKVSVTFEHPEFLETTYPKFTGKWEVTADNEGNLVDKDGKKYYALYWDEKKVHEVDFSEGFYVEKDDAIEFLESKLSYIGLNDYERNEFIMYWLPILEKNKKSLVYFELTEERESYNKINISPKPDSLLRVVIHIKKVDKKVDIKKQNLVRVQRKGFVAVEWGGTTY